MSRASAEGRENLLVMSDGFSSVEYASEESMISHVEAKLHGRANVWPSSRDSEIFQTQFYANSVGYYNFGQLAVNGRPIVSQPHRFPIKLSVTTGTLRTNGHGYSVTNFVTRGRVKWTTRPSISVLHECANPF